MSGGDVFVVEGDDVTFPRESGECPKIRVVSDGGQRNHLSGRCIGPLGQEVGLDTQPDGCLLHHPGQLPTPDDSDPITTIHGAAAYYSTSGSPSKIRSAITT